MTLYKFVEAESGVLHWVASHDSLIAQKEAHYRANLAIDREKETIPLDDIKPVEVSPNESFIFFSERNPIKHTVQEWEIIFTELDIESPRYIACSEY